MSATLAVTQDDIKAAIGRVAGVAVTTPLLESELLNRLSNRRILVKAECLQVTGSFKFRGAWNALSSLSRETLKRGVIAYSSGNHAQGVAAAAARLRTKATIIMPIDAPHAKLAATRALGAEVITYDRARGESREVLGAELAEKHALTLIRPYDDPRVIAGQATCGVELAEQVKLAGVSKADVLTCCGGGGLTAGIALALSERAPNLRVRPVEPDTADDTCRSLAAGVRLANAGTPDTLCDAIITPTPGELSFPIMRQLCGPGISVSDSAVLDAMALALRLLKIVVEPGGAVALAAAISGADGRAEDDIVVVASGGNVDPELVAATLTASRSTV
jgi:threonine dehydratase